MPGILLDIIVTVYNGEEYIEDFLASFFGQADPRARLIFVDDGSTDETSALLDKCGEKSCFRTLTIHQENTGIGRARNRAIDVSDAEYIAFFDIDDICAPDYVKELLDAIDGKEDFDALVFKRKKLYGSEDAEGFRKGEESVGKEDMICPGNKGLNKPEEKKCPYHADKDVMLRDVLFDTEKYGNIHNLLVKRELTDRYNIRMNTELAYYEDYDFCYRVLGRADRIAYLDRWLYGYVVKREGSIMAKYSPEKLRCLRVTKELEPVFEESAPEFASTFKRYAQARLYWSALWQTALASPSYGDFLDFARATNARVYMRKLGSFPERKVRFLRALFFTSKPLYYLAAKMLGRRYTAITPADRDMLKDAATACPNSQ